MAKKDTKPGTTTKTFGEVVGSIHPEIGQVFARNLKMLNILSRCVSGIRGCPYLITYYVEPQCHYRKGVKYANSGEIGTMVKDLNSCPWSRRKYKNLEEL
jgi:hypothetical protein